MKKDSMYIYNSNALAVLIRKDTWGGEAGIYLTAGTICIIHKTRGLNPAAHRRIIVKASR